MRRKPAKAYLTVLLCLIMMIGLMPANTFAYMGEWTLQSGESITRIADLSKTAYSVDYGTEKAKIGLPDTVKATITKAAATEADKPATRTAEVNVVWKGTYNGNIAGDYTLTATLADS